MGGDPHPDPAATIPTGRHLQQAKRGLIVYRQAGEPTFCCEGMRRQWGRLITFGVPGHPETTGRDVSLCTAIPQAGGKVALVLTAVEFCPWCGEAVEACRVK